MKKIIILFAATALIAAGAYAQTQKTNRTHTRTHDRSEVIIDSTNKIDKTAHQPDMDRNNTHINENTPMPNRTTDANGTNIKTDTSKNINANHPK